MGNNPPYLGVAHINPKGDYNNGIPSRIDVANARLIAASPDLLAACEAWLLWDAEVYAAKETGESEYSYIELQAMRQDAGAKARAAIAKATGK